jgi:hypothetical protein
MQHQAAAAGLVFQSKTPVPALLFKYFTLKLFFIFNTIDSRSQYFSHFSHQSSKLGTPIAQLSVGSGSDAEVRKPKRKARTSENDPAKRKDKCGELQ